MGAGERAGPALLVGGRAAAVLPEFEAMVPFVPALVALDEDPAVRLVTGSSTAIRTSSASTCRVRVVFRPLEFEGVERRVMAPKFMPADP